MHKGGLENDSRCIPKKTGKYKSGIWVRDSSAGIGTVTYYDPNTGNFAGLGHGICDVDTGEIMPLQSGEVCNLSLIHIFIKTNKWKNDGLIPGRNHELFKVCQSMPLRVGKRSRR